ncbi:MAG: replication initiation protein [Lachnospiraceae bacterium]|nr:replication initiation protein [Lachnospiraceae bacterium]
MTRKIPKIILRDITGRGYIMGELITTYAKSNDMISAKYMSNLIENQIMAIALSRIEETRNGELEAKLYPRDLYSMIDDKSNIYKSLKKVSKTITGHSMVVEDGRGNFKAFSIIPNADYQDGVFSIKFNKELKSHILALEEKFATFEIELMKNFKNNSSFRLYELLKKDFYKAGKSGEYDVEYNLSELKFIIGCANSDNEAHRNRLATMGKNIDWDELYSKLDKKDKKYVNFADFKKWVLDVAQSELNEKADMSFTYEEGMKKNKKVISIIFHLYKNNPSNPIKSTIRKDWNEKNGTSYQQTEFPTYLYPELYKEYVGHNNLTEKDITILVNKSNGDIDKVKAAIEYVDNYSAQTFVNNYMGMIIRCIEENWTNIPVARGSVENAKHVINVMKATQNRLPQDEEKIAMASWNRLKKDEEKWNDFTKEFIYQFGITPEEAEKEHPYSELFSKCYAPYLRHEKMKLDIIVHTKDITVLKPEDDKEEKIVVEPNKRVVKGNPKKKLWEKAKSKPEFNEFNNMLKEEFDYEMEELEAAYSYEELLKAFKAYQEGEEFEL